MKYYNHSIAAILLFTSVFTGCGDKRNNNPSDVTSPVSVKEVKKGSISKLINTTGTALATYETTINSEMSGMYQLQNNPATGKPFKLGDVVKEGQLIIRLDDKEYENGIALDGKKLSLDIAQQEQVKQKELYEKGGVTLSEMRNSEVKVTNARYDYENAQIKLSRMNIVAPFNGVIVNLPYYTPKSRIEQAKPLVGFMDYSKMYMEINMPESAIGYIKPEQPVYITHYTLPKDTLSGTISELSPAISTETRTFKGKLLINNNKLMLRPGMFVKADIVVDRADSAIIISKNVIQSDRHRKHVFIIEKNTAVLRYIKTGMEDEDNIEILDGLNVNDALVVRGFETLRENSKVKIQK